MDTSETYIKMCEKAVEIQKIWNPTFGDWLQDEYISIVSDEELARENKKKNDVWLPRQDQLQEMVGCNPGNWIIWMDKFISDREYFYTLEQTWLAFVMKKKYGKIWNGEDWVVVK